jgi:alpha-N-arabinofuranosidase
MTRYGNGRVLRAEVDSPTYAATAYDPRGAVDLHFPLPEVPYLKLAAVESGAGGALTLFAVNRHLAEEMPLAIELERFADVSVEDVSTLRDDDLEAANTKEAPERVRPTALAGWRAAKGRLLGALPPASWTVIRLRTSRP